MAIKWLFSIGILFSCGLAQAQDRKQLPLVTPQTDSHGHVLHADTTIIKNQVPQKDLTDVLKSIFHKKHGKAKNDSLIVKPVYTGIPAIGYTLQSRLVVTLTGNVAFRLDSTTKLSTISASAAYSQNKQFTMPVQSSIWTHNNRYNLVGDIRYFKYPQSTFGVGSNSYKNEEDPMDYQFFRFYEVALRNITGNFFAGAGYIFDYHWAISHQNKFNFNADSYATYGTATSTVSTGPTLNLLYDSRSNAIHPTGGTYASVQYRTSSRWLGSTANWHSVLIDARKYYHFPANSDNIIAFWSYNWLVLGGKPPYLDLPATGWDAFGNTGRGYIQGRFRGTKMVYGETEYRFGITRNGLFGGVVFANAQSFAAGPNTGLEKIQPGYGLGLRMKINKVSNTNISIDYGFGVEGSRGLFINIGEMF